MTDSLRDQLLGLGFKPAAKPEKASERRPESRPEPRQAKPAPARGPASRPARAPARGQGAPAASRSGGRSREEMDLAKAYAIRAQKEKEERIEAERLRQLEAARRREAKARVAELLKDQALNDPAAEIARHFEYGGRIKRVHVNADQLRALNAGALAVVQLDGRYLLVSPALADQVAALLPSLVALRVDPDAPVADDPYADPQYQVPDDLVW